MRAFVLVQKDICPHDLSGNKLELSGLHLASGDALECRHLSPASPISNFQAFGAMSQWSGFIMSSRNSTRQRSISSSLSWQTSFLGFDQKSKPLSLRFSFNRPIPVRRPRREQLLASPLVVQPVPPLMVLLSAVAFAAKLLDLIMSFPVDLLPTSVDCNGVALILSKTTSATASPGVASSHRARIFGRGCPPLNESPSPIGALVKVLSAT